MQLIYLILTGCCLAAALQDVAVEHEWSQYKENFSKCYKDSFEEDNRYMKFKENLQTIKEHNRRYENGEVSYEMGLNKYSDMDIYELENKLMGLKMSESDRQNFLNAPKFVPLSSSLKDIPNSLDWRTAGAVTPVKNQQQCRSSWAFAAIGALESRHFLKTHKLVSLSEQNLIDCSKKDGGCSGGWMATAYDYIRDNGGIDTDAFYPYRAVQGSCKFGRNNIGATCSGYDTISRGNEKDLLVAVATQGPVAAAIDVTSAFKNYKSGVFNDNSCSTQHMNHAVVIIGYGRENGQDYWLVKNSWGANWGEKGYIKMSRNRNNQCGIASYAIFPNVQQGVAEKFCKTEL